MKKISQKSWMIILGVLLLIAAAYICFDIYSERQAEKQIAFYQEGLQVGYEQAVLQIVGQLSLCQTVPLHVGNQTINAVAVECLQENKADFS